MQNYIYFGVLFSISVDFAWEQICMLIFNLSFFLNHIIIDEPSQIYSKLLYSKLVFIVICVYYNYIIKNLRALMIYSAKRVNAIKENNYTSKCSLDLYVFI